MLNLLLFKLFIVLGFCTSSERDISFLPFDPVNLKEAILKSSDDSKPIMLYFHANWCGICHTMNQVVWPDQDLQNMMTAFRVIDMHEAQKDVYQQRLKYGINSYPSLVFLSPQGDKLAKFAGMLPVDNLIKITNSILDKYPPQGPRPKVRTAKEKLPLDWSNDSIGSISKQAKQQDRPFIIFYAPKSNPLSSKLREFIENDLKFRRLLKFFIIKDLSLDAVVRDTYVQKYSLKAKPILLLMDIDNTKLDVLHYRGDNLSYHAQMKLMMRKISQIFNNRLLRRIDQRAKLEIKKQVREPKYIPKYLIYEYRQFKNIDAVLIFSENHGLAWLTEGDLLEGNRILDIRVKDKKLLIQADTNQVAITSAYKDKAVSVEAILPLSSIGTINQKNH